MSLLAIHMPTLAGPVRACHCRFHELYWFIEPGSAPDSQAEFVRAREPDDWPKCLGLLTASCACGRIGGMDDNATWPLAGRPWPDPLAPLRMQEDLVSGDERVYEGDMALGILETTGLVPALAALDAMAKAAKIRVIQAELNDLYGIRLKIQGTIADVQAAIAVGAHLAAQFGGQPVADVIASPDRHAWLALVSPPEFNPLIQQDVVLVPSYEVVYSLASHKESIVSSSASFALGLIETQGFTAVFEAIDSACKAANVEVIGKEKLGGGYVTVVIKGDVAAVKAAVDAGCAKVEGLGKLIAAHVIARPSEAVLSLLPKA